MTATYIVTFSDHAGDTCEVDQPARSAIDAVRAVHTGYGRIAEIRNGAVYYQTTTARGVITYRARRNRIEEMI